MPSPAGVSDAGSRAGNILRDGISPFRRQRDGYRAYAVVQVSCEMPSSAGKSALHICRQAVLPRNVFTAGHEQGLLFPIVFLAVVHGAILCAGVPAYAVVATRQQRRAKTPIIGLIESAWISNACPVVDPSRWIRGGAPSPASRSRVSRVRYDAYSDATRSRMIGAARSRPSTSVP
jgi:hypothetical protein